MQVSREPFGERLETLLSVKGILGYELAAKLNCSPALVSKWITGRSSPNLDYLLEIAAALDTTVSDLLGTADSAGSEVAVRIFENQHLADEDIKNFVLTKQPEEVYLIQYSSDYIKPILQFLLHQPELIQIYLLIKHPGRKILEDEPCPISANSDIVAEFQRSKILNHLHILYNTMRLERKPNVTIRCYQYPGALRGIYLGTPLYIRAKADEGKVLLRERITQRTRETRGLLSMSWYHYTSDGVIGDTNPLVHAYSDSDEGILLFSLFEDSFVNLWDASVPALDVFETIKE